MALGAEGGIGLCDNEDGLSAGTMGETISSCERGNARLTLEGPSSTGDTGEIGAAAANTGFTVLASGYFE